MSKEDQQIIIEYPEAFPITGALREVFTERLRTFFDGCSTWSCSRSSTAWESSYGVPGFPHALTPPVPAGIAAPQPQSSPLAAPPRQDVAPRQEVITPGPFRQGGTTPGVSTP